MAASRMRTGRASALNTPRSMASATTTIRAKSPQTKGEPTEVIAGLLPEPVLARGWTTLAASPRGVPRARGWGAMKDWFMQPAMAPALR